MEEEFWNNKSNDFWEDEEPEELIEENVVIEQERSYYDQEEDDEWYEELMNLEEEPESVKQIRNDPSLQNWIPMAPPSKVNDTAKYAYNYLNQKGIPNHVSAGIVGNLLKESNLNPRIKDGDKRGGIGGIAQWDPTRSRNLINYSAQNNADPYSLETQLDFVIHESKQRGDLDKTMQARTPEEAALIFGRTYERPNEKYADWNTRQSYARGLTMKYGGIRKAQSGINNIPSNYLEGVSDEAILEYLEDENYEVELEDTPNNNILGTIGNVVSTGVNTINKLNQFKNDRIDKATSVARNAVEVAAETAGIRQNALSLRKFRDQQINKKYQLNTQSQNNIPIYV